MVVSGFLSADLVPLWDRPPDFLPLQPPAGSYRWSFDTVRDELQRIAETLPKEAAERRVALLSHPGMPPGIATDGLNAGIQMLLPGERAEAHRHTPAALRVGLVASGVVTTVDGVDYPLDRLDVVLNPSGTWHGHHADDEGDGGFWLDVVDLPLVAALGGTLFEPPGSPDDRALPAAADPVDPVRSPIRYPWSSKEELLWSSEPIGGVRKLEYGSAAVMTTMAVTAYGFEVGAELRFPARTAGAIVLAAGGRFRLDGHDSEPFDVVALRAWTPYALTCIEGPGVVIAVDTSPALRRLGLYREERSG